jgi:DNA-directed RNA polymerase specialized sigma24 family protein
VIFVLDVESCIKRLDKGSQELIARIALQEYSQSETAVLTRQSLRSTVRRYADALDALTRIFLRCELLEDQR